MSKRQNKRANVVEVSSDATNAPTRKTPVAIIPLTGDPALDAETLRKLLGAARLPIVYPQNSTLETIRQQVS